ncbi:hypothetical protein [Sutcliffiella cohnii]|uniref:hypothetical protein n=1 Tax=Sutcliffiella cohnii TaxID=33932 RepID=UPI0008317EF4|nr:hypothetical protein [Sutcliffiella cohnii]
MLLLENGVERDEQKLKSLFVEEIEVKFIDIGRNYSEFEIVAIEGNPIDCKPIFYFYRDDIYTDPLLRDPDYFGTLIGYETGNSINGTAFYYKKRFTKSTFTKLSIFQVIQELYSNTKR